MPNKVLLEADTQKSTGKTSRTTDAMESITGRKPHRFEEFVIAILVHFK